MSKEPSARKHLPLDRLHLRRIASLLVGTAVLGAGLLQSFNGLAAWWWAQRDPAPWFWSARRLEQLDPLDPAVRVEALVRLVVGLVLLLVGGWLLRRGLHSRTS